MGGLARAAIAAVAFCASSAAVGDQMPICPDRPGKGTGTCTVPAGRWQVETGLIDWAHDRTGGVSSDYTVIGSSLIKYGITDRADIELGITPYERLQLHGEDHFSSSSFGDTLVRLKYRVTKDGAPVAVALDPYIKLPTANHDLGNRKVEAGIALPLSAPLGKSPVTLGLTPEADLRANPDGSGHHTAMTQVVNVGLAASSSLTISGELWGMWEWFPAGTLKQYSADGSLAYLVNNNTQIDGGVNLGLNRTTPDVELYAGISTRF